LRTCRHALREATDDLRFGAPAAYGVRMVIAAIDALAQLITKQPHVFTEQDAGGWRNQTGGELSAPTVERLLDAMVSATAPRSELRTA